MINSSPFDKNMVGKFNIGDDEYDGQISCLEQGNPIYLTLNLVYDDKPYIAPSNYVIKQPIHGKLNNGCNILILGAKCVGTRTHPNHTEELRCVCESILECGNIEKSDLLFNEFDFVIENGLGWGNISNIEADIVSDTIQIGGEKKTYKVKWFDNEITFYTVIRNELYSFPRKETCELSEHLAVSISNAQKQPLEYFLAIRDKIISLISFGVANNINILSQVCLDYDIPLFDDRVEYYHEFPYLAYEQKRIIDKKPWRDYNFTLNQLPSKNKLLANYIDKLIPVFNLYLSWFRYQDMPIEMIFLNLIQATEVLHARFFCKEHKSKEKYVARIEKKYATLLQDEAYKRMLLSDEHQLKDDIDFVCLYSRINELVFDNNSKIFYDFYASDKADNQFICDIVKTRNYFTHYDSSDAKRILNEDGLIKAISFLRVLLEYHICKILGIDKAGPAREALQHLRNGYNT